MRRLFVGLMADSRVQAELTAYQDRWDWTHGARVTPPGKLHLTLLFLGDVNLNQEMSLRRWLGEVRLSRFDLLLGRPEVLADGIAVLLPQWSAALEELQERVQAVAAWSRLSTEARPWIPHVTLARNVGAQVAPRSPLWVRWPVSEFSLICSTPSGYDIVQTWHAA